MFVTAVVVEQLENDGYLRTFKMWAKPESQYTVAFADEYEKPRRGPFHFLDQEDEETFEKGFGDCKSWKLPESRFTFADGIGIFRTSWDGIRTEENRLSYYSLSLPEFAVPLEIRFKNPHSGRVISKTVIRDDERSRYVTYLGCRSSHGSFAFSLNVTFKYDQLGFHRSEYADDHMSRDAVHIPSPEYLLVPVDPRFVAEFLAQNSGQPKAALPSLPLTLAPPENAGPQNFNGAESNPFAGLQPKKRDFSAHFDRANLTEIQHQVISLRLEYGLSVSAIAKRLGRSRKTIDEHIEAAQKRIDHGWYAGKRASKRSEPATESEPSTD